MGGFPRTCLHALLDLIELSVASLRENSMAELETVSPHVTLLVQQWDAAMAWQILYHLMAATSTTAVPVSRYLRGNHDLVARHLTNGLMGVFLASSPSKASSGNASGSGMLMSSFHCSCEVSHVSSFIFCTSAMDWSAYTSPEK